MFILRAYLSTGSTPDYCNFATVTLQENLTRSISVNKKGTRLFYSEVGYSTTSFMNFLV